MARRFGVRAGMPGFIGKKLCPQLVLIKPNFSKYAAVSEDVQEVLSLYDPEFSSAGLDEAYLDITNYVDTVEGSKPCLDMAADVVNELRCNIFEKTGLTASAGKISRQSAIFHT